MMGVKGKLALWAVLSAAGLGGLAACGDSDGGHGDGERCIPGQSLACACVDGRTGAQTCQDDGTFAACTCAGGGSEADGGGEPAGSDAAPPPSPDAAAPPPTPDATVPPPPLDAAPPDAAAPPPPDAAPVPPDAAPLPPDAAPDPNPFIGRVWVTGWRDNLNSDWSGMPEAMGAIGLAAGNAYCNFTSGAHVCDYLEMRAAERAGQFAPVPVGTTAWVQRTTPELVDGQLSEPGQGGNCVDWTFTGNHIADGEYVEFAADGLHFYLDNDTHFDGMPSPSVQFPGLPCGGIARSLFCCIEQ